MTGCTLALLDAFGKVERRIKWQTIEAPRYILFRGKNYVLLRREKQRLCLYDQITIVPIFRGEEERKPVE